MITRDNIKSVLKAITPEDLKAIEESDKDYVVIMLWIVNTGYHVEANAFDFCPREMDQIVNNGHCWMDRDEFYELLATELDFKP